MAAEDSQLCRMRPAFRRIFLRGPARMQGLHGSNIDTRAALYVSYSLQVIRAWA